jgi:hypothetical protein
MAKESGELADILAAIKQVVQSCAVSAKFDVEGLPIFALEYVFLKLRAHSIDSIVKLTFNDNEDGEDRTFAIDLLKVELEYPDKKKHDGKIKLTPKIGLVMKYPPASLYGDKSFIESGDKYLFELIKKCIERVYEGDEIYEWKDFSGKEQDEFLESLDIKSFDKIREFLDSTPRMKHVIEYKNSMGNDRKIELSALSDFFTL